MVTIALAPEMWIAYDATHASLYRAWRGGVNFEGAVYTTVHGPQPTSYGQAYLRGSVDRPVWYYEVSRRRVPFDPRFRGYSFQAGRVSLHYELLLPDGGSVLISESPEFRIGTKGRPQLERRFTVQGLPVDIELGVEVAYGALANPQGLETAGEIQVLEQFETRVRAASGEIVPAFDMTGRLRLTEGETNLTATFVEISERSVTDKSPPEKSNQEAEPVDEYAGLDEVETTRIDPVQAEYLIPPCIASPAIDGEIDSIWQIAVPHSLKKRIVGEDSGSDLSARVRLLYDSKYLYGLFEVQDETLVTDSALPFNDDSCEVYIDAGNEKVNFYDENDAQFVFSSSAPKPWTNPDSPRFVGALSQTRRNDSGYQLEFRIPWAAFDFVPQAGREIGLEVHVDDDDDGDDVDTVISLFSSASNGWSDPSLFGTWRLGARVKGAPVPDAPRESGLGMRVYNVGRSISELKELVPGQTANVNRLISQIDLDGPEDFGGLSATFLTEITGFLEVPVSGEIEFVLTSDDGSELWIDHSRVIDHDGLHGAEPKQARIELDAGLHPIRIRHFENQGGERLALSWKLPQGEYERIPAARFSTPAGEVRVTSPGVKRVVEKSLQLKPGDRAPLDGVHPSYTLYPIRPEGFEPRVGGLDFLPDGRLAVCTWDAEGAVYLLEGVLEEDPNRVKVKKIAAGLAEPLGLRVVDGQIFVLQKQELTQLVDRDGDDVIDEYRAIANGWGVTANFHEFAFGLAYKEGAFYAALATAIEPGGKSSPIQNPDRGSVIKIDRTGDFDFIARGLRTPNGVGIGVDGQIFVTDNQGDWLPCSKVVHLEPGRFYGNRSVAPERYRDREETPPVAWLPQGEIGNSPGEPIFIPSGPYRGQMLHAEVTHGGLKRMFVESVGGAYQAAVFRFTQGLEAGINRVVWAPDGSLIAGGIGSTGNWGQEGKKRYGLERLKPNGEPTFEILAVRSRKNGFELEFTEPLAGGTGSNPIDYELKSWRYEPGPDYGGPKLDERTLRVMTASVSEDRKRVFLEIPGLEPSRVVYIRLVGPWRSEADRALWSTETWYTLNSISETLGEVTMASRQPTNQLSDEEMENGFELLFDGKTLAGWRGMSSEEPPAGWRVDDGTLTFVPGGVRGDVVTNKRYENFELRLEWKIAEGGNSGIFFGVDPAVGPPWETGPEMQILDNEKHPDGKSGLTSAGANYALHAPKFDATRRAGLFNEVRIVVRNRAVEYWLNGHRIVEYTLDSEDWRERVQKSKFSSYSKYGRTEAGHIVLQDHGDPVWFRNIRIREVK